MSSPSAKSKLLVRPRTTLGAGTVTLGAGFRCFVTATDTGVGKTQVSCALLSLLRDQGLNPAPFKPYETGCEELDQPADALRMREAAGSQDPLERICPHRFQLPLAPGVAAARLGIETPFSSTVAAFRAFENRPVVAEGAGGLFVPIDSERDIIDLIVELRLPVLLVARAGLGTLNHTALSLEALTTRKIPVIAVVLSQAIKDADPSTEDNARWIEERYGARVLGPVPFVRSDSARHEAFREALSPLLQR